jgi:hypothetical protein
MLAQEKPSAKQIGFFGLKALAQEADALANWFRQPNGAQSVSHEFARFNVSAYQSTHLFISLKTRDFLTSNASCDLTAALVIPQT